MSSSHPEKIFTIINFWDYIFKERNFQDLVIHASPSNPPHSLPLLRERMEKLGVPVYARTHVHSAIAGNKLLSDTLKSFICSDSRLERSQAHMAITLIWIKGIIVFLFNHSLILLIIKSLKQAMVKNHPWWSHHHHRL